MQSSAAAPSRPRNPVGSLCILTPQRPPESSRVRASARLTQQGGRLPPTPLLSLGSSQPGFLGFSFSRRCARSTMAPSPHPHLQPSPRPSLACQDIFLRIQPLPLPLFPPDRGASRSRSSCWHAVIKLGRLGAAGCPLQRT